MEDTQTVQRVPAPNPADQLFALRGSVDHAIDIMENDIFGIDVKEVVIMLRAALGRSA